MADDQDEVEVFQTRDEMVAQTALGEVLNPIGIEGHIHNRMSHALPAPASMSGGYFLAVPVDRAGEAIAALRDAIRDGILQAEEDDVLRAPPA